MFSTGKWWNDLKSAQSALPTHVDPIIDLQEVDKKKAEITAQLIKLSNKPKPAAPQPPKEEAPKEQA